MTDMKTVLNFAALSEIKNVIMTLNLPSYDKTYTQYWEINDQIMFGYEHIQDIITQLKQNRYNATKLANKEKVTQCMLTTNETHGKYYDVILTKQKINDIHIHQQINAIACKKYEKDEVETMINEITDKKNTYNANAVQFLQTYDFFYYDDKHVLTPDIIMCSHKFQTYLRQLFSEIRALSIVVVNYRITSDSYAKVIENSTKAIAYYNARAEVPYYTEHYKVVDNNEIKCKQEKLIHLVTQLYILLKTVKQSYMFLNAIVNSLVFMHKISTFNTEINDLLIKFRQDERNNKHLLPTSYWDYVKKWFVTERVNGVIQPAIGSAISDYMRYMCCWFEFNRINNTYDQFIYKVNNEDKEEIDYVAFLFGPSIDTYNRNEYMNSLYTLPFVETEEKSNEK